MQVKNLSDWKTQIAVKHNDLKKKKIQGQMKTVERKEDISCLEFSKK